jgi:hypothetical protein
MVAYVGIVVERAATVDVGVIEGEWEHIISLLRKQMMHMSISVLAYPDFKSNTNGLNPNLFN